MVSIRRVLSLAAVLACLSTGFGGRPTAADAGLQGLYTATDASFEFDIPGRTWQIRLVRHYFLFYPDGRVYAGLPLGGLEAFDFTQAQRERPSQCGAYEVQGDQIQFTFLGASGPSLQPFQAGVGTLKIDRLSFLRVDRGAEPLTLDGEYGMTTFPPVSTGSNGSQGGESRDYSISFTPDRRFYEREIVSVPSSTESGSVLQERGASGTYAITGSTLELTYTNGERRQLTFFLYPAEPAPLPSQLIAIDGVHLRRRGAPVMPPGTPTRQAPRPGVIDPDVVTIYAAGSGAVAGLPAR